MTKYFGKNHQIERFCETILWMSRFIIFCSLQYYVFLYRGYNGVIFRFKKKKVNSKIKFCSARAKYQKFAQYNIIRCNTIQFNMIFLVEWLIDGFFKFFLIFLDIAIQYNWLIDWLVFEIQYNTIQYNAIQYNTIQFIHVSLFYITIQYNTTQYNTIR